MMTERPLSDYRPITLSPKQLSTLEALRQFARAHHYPPTIRELAAILGVSHNAAHARIKSLEKRRLIIRAPGGNRTMRFTGLGIATLRAADDSDRGGQGI